MLIGDAFLYVVVAVITIVEPCEERAIERRGKRRKPDA